MVSTSVIEQTRSSRRRTSSDDIHAAESHCSACVKMGGGV
jgi:hypothetical protein